MEETISSAKPRPAEVSRRDVFAALSAGWSDFGAAPGFGLVLGGVFALIGVLIYLQLAVWNTSYWIIPMAAGFPLVGPFLAVGLYDVSRTLADGRRPDWASVVQVILGERQRQIPSMVFVVLFAYLVWVWMAHLIFALFFGLKPITNIMSSYDVFLSGSGITMLLIGSLVGGVIAFVLFSISVVSIPMVMDRDVDFVTAMITSFQVVLNNKAPMLLWGLIIAVLSFVAMIPFFLGMLVVFPVLGHASWHLYRRAVTFEITRPEMLSGK